MSALALVVLPAASASAGRLVATGHDVDDHCGEVVDVSEGQCHFMRVATRYVRDGAPIPSRRVLLLDCGGNVESALDQAFGTGNVPRKRMCPSDDPGAFNSESLSTNRFSAIIVGSSCDDEGDDSLNLNDDQVGGCDDPGGDTPDSDLINGRKGDIRRFFNDGGGVFAMAGDENGNGDPTDGPDVYYDFVPLGVQGQEVTPPFCLTDVGIELGFEDQSCPDASQRSGTRDDINCCPTHNSFAEPPQGSALRVAERDSEDFAETLVAEGRIAGGGFERTAKCRGEEADIVGDGTIQGTNGPDVIVGGSGPDKIRGRGGADLICGKEGNDLVRGEGGGDRAFGGADRDEVRGESGKDHVSGGLQRDLVTGGTGDDELVRGPGGRDTLRGGDGNDKMWGGPDSDRLVGGDGRDRLRGRRGDDELAGKEGNDFLDGGPQRDDCNGGRGTDRLEECER